MMELAPDRDGTLDLYVTNKIALRDRQGLIIGMAGASACFEYRRQSMREYLEIAEAVDHIKQNYQTAIAGSVLGRAMPKCQRGDLRRAVQTSSGPDTADVCGFWFAFTTPALSCCGPSCRWLRSRRPSASMITVALRDNFLNTWGWTPLAYRKRYAPKSES